MIWDQLTSPQISRLDKDIPVVLTITATEQHGPHLPLATDRIIGEHFAHELHQSIPEQVLILPVLNIGCSAHHMDFAGTLTLNHESLAQQVQDIVRSVISHGFKKIILLNSHGGNQGIGQVVIEQLGYDYPKAYFVLATWWRIAAEVLEEITETGFGGTGHGGEFETSLMMTIAPHLVVDKEIKTPHNIPAFPWAEGDMLQAPRADHFRSIHEMSVNGVLGDPAAASIEKGRNIIDCVVTALKKIVIDLSEFQNNDTAK